METKTEFIDEYKSMDIENLEYLFGPLSLCQKLLFKINLIFWTISICRLCLANNNYKNTNNFFYNRD